MIYVPNCIMAQFQSAVISDDVQNEWSAGIFRWHAAVNCNPLSQQPDDRHQRPCQLHTRHEGDCLCLCVLYTTFISFSEANSALRPSRVGK